MRTARWSSTPTTRRFLIGRRRWSSRRDERRGPGARAGTPREAALFGDVVLISVPYAALPQVGRDLKTELRGKIVLETGNPYPQRDGDMALEGRRKGTGVASAEYLPGVRLVRAFNAINSDDLAHEAHRGGEPFRSEERRVGKE